MGNIFTIDSEKKLFLYACGTSIFLRTAINADLSRQIVLCNDFADNLSCVIYHGTIHYLYQNRQGDFILRSILDSAILYRLPVQEAPDCFSPVLLTLQNHLLLLYFVKNPLNECFLLKVSFPLEAEEFRNEAVTYKELPVLRFLPLEDRLLITCAHTDSTDCFLFSVDGQFLPLRMPDQTPKEALLPPVEEIIHNLEEKMLLQAKEWSQKVEEKEKLILSAKKQYEELMNTATRYRDEATKWHNKYYATRNK